MLELKFNLGLPLMFLQIQIKFIDVGDLKLWIWYSQIIVQIY